MHIFIDEAGIFTDPKQVNDHKVSAVGALIIPDYAYPIVAQEWQRLTKKWGYKGEVKGSQIKEEEIVELVPFLEQNNVLFDVVMVDAKFLSPNCIATHRQKCAQHILSNISIHHHPNVQKQLTNLSEIISGLSDQLYVQYQVMTPFFYRVHQYSTAYYVQRSPQELAAFKWIIDAKDKNLTPAERSWRVALQLSLQSISDLKPFIMLPGVDYSYYAAFDGETPNEGNINKIIADLRFCDSSTNEGLQLVDVLTTPIKKAMHGKFARRGWLEIGKLMTTGFRQESFIPMYVFNEAMPSVVQVPYAGIIDELRSMAKPIFTKSFGQSLENPL